MLRAGREELGVRRALQELHLHATGPGVGPLCEEVLAPVAEGGHEHAVVRLHDGLEIAGYERASRGTSPAGTSRWSGRPLSASSAPAGA